MSCEMIYFVKTIYESPQFIQNHFHPCYELVYYLKGSGRSEISGTQYEFHENTFFLIQPKHIHNEQEYQYVEVMFTGFTTNNYQLTEGIFPDKDGSILRLMSAIHGEMQQKKPYYRSMMNALTEELILNVLRIVEAQKVKEDSFEYSLNYIDANATKNISIQQIAANLGYNYDYLRHLFINKMNISAKQYLLEAKLNNVRDILLHSDVSLDTIASMTGFSSASHLCMVFRKAEHMTPKEYKQIQQANQLLDNKAVKTSSLEGTDC